MSLERFKLSEAEKAMLSIIKRRTSLKNWNVACRWALCLSLAEETEPPEVPIVSDSNVEMTWETFAGDHAVVYRALIVDRCLKRGEEPTEEILSGIFRHHLNRGLSYLRGRDDLVTVEQLVRHASAS